MRVERPPGDEFDDADRSVRLQRGLPDQQWTQRIVTAPEPGSATESRQRMLHLHGLPNERAAWVEPGQHRSGVVVDPRVDHNISELGLAHHHLGDRAAILQSVISEGLLKPSPRIQAAHDTGDPHVTGRRTIHVSRTETDPNMLDCPTDRLRFKPLPEMDDHPVDITTAVQSAQQDKQIVSDRAGNTPVG
jgi:hypothetical protein